MGLKALQGTKARSMRRPIMFIIFGLLLTAAGLLILQSHTFLGVPGARAPSLMDLMDVDLTKNLTAVAQDHPYTRCAATRMRPRNQEYASADDIIPQLTTLPPTNGKLNGSTFVELLVADVPCWGMSNCCETGVYLRPGEAHAVADVDYFRSTFQQHDLKLLYAIFNSSTPKFVLDAGTGVGSSTQMLKLIFPYSVHVALEPDPLAFEILMYNVREVDGVHAVHGALWPLFSLLEWRGSSKNAEKRTLVPLPLNDDDEDEDGYDDGHAENKRKYGLKERAREVMSGGGVIGYGIRELKAMFDIPQFDVVCLDIEGAEGLMLSPKTDVRWVRDAQVVVLKLHKSHGKAYRIKSVAHLVAQTAAALRMTVLQDGDFVYLLSPSVAEKLRASDAS